MAPFRVRQARSPRRWKSNYSLIVLVGLLLVAGCGGGSGSPQAGPTPVHFVPNSHAFWSDPQNWTTSYGPAYANILLAPTNFVPCRGGPFALCFTSGAEFRYGRSFLPTDRRRQVRELPVLRHSLRRLFRRYQRDSEPFGLPRHHRAVRRRRQRLRGVELGPGLPVGEPGYVDAERETFFHFQFRLYPHQRYRTDQLRRRALRRLHDGAMLAADKSGLTTCSCPVYDGPYRYNERPGLFAGRQAGLVGRLCAALLTHADTVGDRA